MQPAEMSCLRWMSGLSLWDGVRSAVIWDGLRFGGAGDQLRQSQMGLLGYPRRPPVEFFFGTSHQKEAPEKARDPLEYLFLQADLEATYLGSYLHHPTLQNCWKMEMEELNMTFQPCR